MTKKYILRVEYLEKSSSDIAIYDYTIERDSNFLKLQKELTKLDDFVYDEFETEEYFWDNACLEESNTYAESFYNETISKHDIMVTVDDILQVKVNGDIYELRVWGVLDELYGNENAKRLFKEQEERDEKECEKLADKIEKAIDAQSQWLAGQKGGLEFDVEYAGLGVEGTVCSEYTPAQLISMCSDFDENAEVYDSMILFEEIKPREALGEYLSKYQIDNAELWSNIKYKVCSDLALQIMEELPADRDWVWSNKITVK